LPPHFGVVLRKDSNTAFKELLFHYD